MRTKLKLHGETAEIELRMWSKRQRDALERKYKVGGSTFVMSIAGTLLQSGGKGPSVQVAKDLIKEEATRQNEDNIHYDAERICAIARKADGTAFTLEEVEDLPDDEYAALNTIVVDFVVGMPEKSVLLKLLLTKLLKDSPACGPALQIVDDVMSGKVTEKN